MFARRGIVPPAKYYRPRRRIPSSVFDKLGGSGGLAVRQNNPRVPDNGADRMCVVFAAALETCHNKVRPLRQAAGSGRGELTCVPAPRERTVRWGGGGRFFQVRTSKCRQNGNCVSASFPGVSEVGVGQRGACKAQRVIQVVPNLPFQEFDNAAAQTSRWGDDTDPAPGNQQVRGVGLHSVSCLVMEIVHVCLDLDRETHLRVARWRFQNQTILSNVLVTPPPR